MRFGYEYVESALYSQGRNLIVVDNKELKYDAGLKLSAFALKKQLNTIRLIFRGCTTIPANNHLSICNRHLIVFL